MRSSILTAALDALRARLRAGNLQSRPGDRTDRQPIHTVYGGAQLFTHDIAGKLGAGALAALERYGATPAELAAGIGADLSPELAAVVHARVTQKLVREPVEDFRIDFEDGFGLRPDADEDAAAVACADQVARGMAEGTLPPFLGIRIKNLGEELAGRALRTLDLFVTTLAGHGRGLPDGFVVTLPKIQNRAQVVALADALDALEGALGLPTVPMELMIELPATVCGPDGRNPIPELVEAGRGRVRGAHFGTYDYTAACNITAAWQAMDHPACDHALLQMQVALAGTPTFLSDGATNVLPVPPHKDPQDDRQRAENRAVVHRAWALAARHIQRSLRMGVYQGWDLHPAQLPVRYAAAYAFFLQSLPAATERLRNFVEQATRATLVGDVFDDAATGQGLLNHFVRAMACGAITDAEVAATGLTQDELRGRSFLAILAARRG